MPIPAPLQLRNTDLASTVAECKSKIWAAYIFGLNVKDNCFSIHTHSLRLPGIIKLFEQSEYDIPVFL